MEGKDLSSSFTDILKCKFHTDMQLFNLEEKKGEGKILEGFVIAVEEEQLQPEPRLVGQRLQHKLQKSTLQKIAHGQLKEYRV